MMGRLVRAQQVLVIAGLALVAAGAQAQDVEPTAEQEVEIAGLSDLSASPALTSFADIVLRDEICVRTIGGLGAYNVAIDTSAGGYSLARAGGGTSVPFVLVWEGWQQERSRSSPGPFGTFANGGAGCGADAFAAAYRLELERDALLEAVSGSYQNSLIITMSVP